MRAVQTEYPGECELGEAAGPSFAGRLAFGLANVVTRRRVRLGSGLHSAARRKHSGTGNNNNLVVPSLDKGGSSSSERASASKGGAAAARDMASAQAHRQLARSNGTVAPRLPLAPGTTHTSLSTMLDCPSF